MTNTLVELRKRLLTRRRELIAHRDASERGVQEVREGRTDPEYEESAQAEHLEYTLGALSESQQRELLMIDAAIARLDAGSYGECLDCEQEIVPERLDALPYAVRCTDCAAKVELREHPYREPATL